MEKGLEARQQRKTADEPRVVTRRQAGGAGEGRLRTYQRHLALFVLVNGLGVGADLFTRPGLQFWHWVLAFWGLAFLAHTLGLISRGYTVGDLLTRARPPERIEEDAPPLEYELIKSRQLRDGVTRTAAAVREREPRVVDDAVQAADELQAGVEELVTAARAAGATGDDEGGGRVRSSLETALERLDELHEGLLRASVFEVPAEEALAADPAHRHAESLRELAQELKKAAGTGADGPG